MNKLILYLNAFVIGFSFPITTLFMSSFCIGALIAKYRKQQTNEYIKL